MAHLNFWTKYGLIIVGRLSEAPPRVGPQQTRTIYMQVPPTLPETALPRISKQTPKKMALSVILWLEISSPYIIERFPPWNSDLYILFRCKYLHEL